MATNDFIGFASNGNANVMSQVEYAAAAEQGDGVQPGMASSALANKVWRQGANMAAALGRITAARGYDALDNGDLDALQSSVDDAISVGTFNRMFFSQTSGTFVASRTGVYRITLKGGGGGGGQLGPNTTRSGCGGGEGGTLIFYETLVKNASYAYTIGAGGDGGVNYADADNPGSTGTTGGTTSFVGPSGTWSVSGGSAGAPSGNITKPGGAGGRSFSAPGTALRIPGATGQTASVADNTHNFVTTGGGSGGSGTTTHGVLGGGGAGAGTQDATNGGDGYILIEYAG